MDDYRLLWEALTKGPGNSLALAQLLMLFLGLTAEEVCALDSEDLLPIPNYRAYQLRITKRCVPIKKNDNDMIIVCVTFAIVGSLKVFDLVYVMTNGGPLHATEVPGTLMYSAIFQKNQYGYGSAIAVFIVLECVLFTFASRWLMNRAFGDDRETKTSRRKGGR